ncbi:hypothetical protein KC19_3G040800 [Ceratodon purpureus]|uniref:Uncharacterized protein n=1 Tax=Ceratodon purpureus TaxID=3225 RepID=A0A8T0IH22_CERPU|nr:hypothetical protein KC19_3G040800 [Ceratodon purpureus]
MAGNASVCQTCVFHRKLLLLLSRRWCCNALGLSLSMDPWSLSPPSQGCPSDVNNTLLMWYLF